jgi:hypothetical protein
MNEDKDKIAEQLNQQRRLLTEALANLDRLQALLLPEEQAVTGTGEPLLNVQFLLDCQQVGHPKQADETPPTQ